MAQLVVRNLDNSVKAKLRRRAIRNGHSMEEEVRDILRDAVNQDDVSAWGLGTEISSLFVEHGLDSDIPELRGHGLKPAAFDE